MSFSCYGFYIPVSVVRSTKVYPSMSSRSCGSSVTLPSRDPYRSNESRGKGEEPREEFEVDDRDAWLRENTEATGEDIGALDRAGVSGESIMLEDSMLQKECGI